MGRRHESNNSLQRHQSPCCPKDEAVVYREGENAEVDEAAEAVSQSGKIVLTDGDSFIIYGHLYTDDNVHSMMLCVLYI